MSEMLKERIEAVAKELLKNTKNESYREELESVLINPREDNNAYIVVKKIAEDGYDITGFALTEMPLDDVYDFFNYDTNQAFSICYFDGAEEPYWGFFYVADWVGDHNGFAADSIQEAIEKYKFDE